MFNCNGLYSTFSITYNQILCPIQAFLQASFKVKQMSHLLVGVVNVSFNTNQQLIKTLETWIDNQKLNTFLNMSNKNPLQPNITTTHFIEFIAFKSEKCISKLISSYIYIYIYI